MATNWKLVREMMETAIQACEQIEGLSADDRALVVDVDGQRVSVFDIVTSAWVYPERVRYQIIRQRREQPYVPEAARVLVNMAQACSELIGADGASHGECGEMLRWYTAHALPKLQQALQSKS